MQAISLQSRSYRQKITPYCCVWNRNIAKIGSLLFSPDTILIYYTGNRTLRDIKQPMARNTFCIKNYLLRAWTKWPIKLFTHYNYQNGVCFCRFVCSLALLSVYIRSTAAIKDLRAVAYLVLSHMELTEKVFFGWTFSRNNSF